MREQSTSESDLARKQIAALEVRAGAAAAERDALRAKARILDYSRQCTCCKRAEADEHGGGT